jgi:7-cyano-7-deazaguanine synthase
LYDDGLNRGFSMADAAVVLLSGGLDSSVLLRHVAATVGARSVYALSFDYGQRHGRELACAAWQAREAGVAAHDVVDLRFLGPLIREGTALVRGGAEVPDLASLTPQALTQPPTYVPNRNMTLLSIAAAYAEARRVRAVYFGAQAQDEYGYWDCTPQFLTRINDLLALNRRDRVVVHAPFVGLTKAAVVKQGLELKVDFAHTWSCYRGGDQACGACPTCVERLKAFEQAGARDPIPYAPIPPAP